MPDLVRCHGVHPSPQVEVVVIAKLVGRAGTEEATHAMLTPGSSRARTRAAPVRQVCQAPRSELRDAPRELRLSGVASSAGCQTPTFSVSAGPAGTSSPRSA